MEKRKKDRDHLAGMKKDISEETLKMIDKSMENLRRGIASEPIDLSEFDKKK